MFANLMRFSNDSKDFMGSMISFQKKQYLEGAEGLPERGSFREAPYREARLDCKEGDCTTAACGWSRSTWSHRITGNPIFSLELFGITMILQELTGIRMNSKELANN